MSCSLFTLVSGAQTDSDVACEEAAKLTAEYQGVDDSPDDDDINYNELPPPPGKCNAMIAASQKLL
jgi:hypothetical protein